LVGGLLWAPAPLAEHVGRTGDAGGAIASSGGREPVSLVSAAQPTTRYEVHGETAPGGDGRLMVRSSTIAFDGSAQTGDLLPGPADLLAAALAACILKNVERFSRILPFRYRHASVEVAVEREEPPPRIVRARYTLRIETDEPDRRVELLHRNIRAFGTITNTLARSGDLQGEILAVRVGDGGASGGEPRAGDPG
jgi:uncharacterized OsmC-like protein